MRRVAWYLSLASFALVGCQSPAPERTEFAQGLRFRYQVPGGDHLFEVRAIERAPRITSFEVMAFEDANGDGVHQHGEDQMFYKQSPPRPTRFVTSTHTGTGSTWESAVYKAVVRTEKGEVTHTWRVSEDDPE